jgi:hypothetical protein
MGRARRRAGGALRRARRPGVRAVPAFGAARAGGGRPRVQDGAPPPAHERGVEAQGAAPPLVPPPARPARAGLVGRARRRHPDPLRDADPGAQRRGRRARGDGRQPPRPRAGGEHRQAHHAGVQPAHGPAGHPAGGRGPSRDAGRVPLELAAHARGHAAERVAGARDPVRGDGLRGGPNDDEPAAGQAGHDVVRDRAGHARPACHPGGSRAVALPPAEPAARRAPGGARRTAGPGLVAGREPAVRRRAGRAAQRVPGGRQRRSAGRRPRRQAGGARAAGPRVRARAGSRVRLAHAGWRQPLRDRVPRLAAPLPAGADRRERAAGPAGAERHEGRRARPGAHRGVVRSGRLPAGLPRLGRAPSRERGRRQGPARRPGHRARRLVRGLLAVRVRERQHGAGDGRGRAHAGAFGLRRERDRLVRRRAAAAEWPVRDLRRQPGREGAAAGRAGGAKRRGRPPGTRSSRTARAAQPGRPGWAGPSPRRRASTASSPTS